MVDKLLSVAKAIGGAIAAGVFTLSGILTGSEGLGDVTTGGWLLVTLAVLASFGIIYRVPNKV